jgi:hypothetical protein
MRILSAGKHPWHERWDGRTSILRVRSLGSGNAGNVRVSAGFLSGFACGLLSYAKKEMLGPLSSAD